MEFGDIDELAHGTIGLGGIELDFALETDGLDDELGEFADGEFFACTYVDVAVTNLTKGWDGSTSTGAVVAIDYTVGLVAIMYAGVFLEATDVLEIYVQENVYTGVCHVFAPKELTQWLACTPQGHLIIFNTIEG